MTLRRTHFKRKQPEDGPPRFSSFDPKPGQPAKPRKRLAPRSEKQRQVYAGSEGVEGRAALVARLLAENPVCSAGMLIGVFKGQMGRWSECGVTSVDVHEILARSAGGSITDERNLRCVCRRCHTFIGDFPNEATKLGLRSSRYQRPNGKD